MSLISVRSLGKRYGDTAVVRGLNLDIHAGECFGLLGPNGAGKTTTLKMLLGLIAPDDGTIEILGEPVPLRGREARIRIGVVPQMDNLDPDFSVAENLLVYGRYFGISDMLIHSRIPALLEFAGLMSKADAKITTLSGGMKRRLTLARALINDPELIVLDEPTTGLDPQARHVIWQGLRRLIAQGKTILLTTHFMEEAERLCDRLVILDHGAAIAAGSPREMIAAEIEPSVIEIYGEGVAEWGSTHAKALCARHEITGETLFCYTHDGTGLLARLHAQNSLRYLHRPSNLEDVFLKFTGRELRDS
ncbi:Nod factor export ATP-binding protein I [Sulfuriferula plumbiphila]|uniref:Nod factor export ATP-binding protein I n=1 Tax=Sulfuriferula plumbiphila TaxID=171865 RepID=A0A512L3Q2_9PROT|nr:ATP-binding cassette domain-containing protein [Sulfuriferula plumbiphila]BBP02805.1 Nod factor export ATP-binding protein I [Sulfuriferula plumbiphila]GEP29099.1 Nod factor export ATP-binding protein I [Sulfuriferula plumbiphila]